MPFIVRCSNCGYLFYYSSNISPIIEILNSLQSNCPSCGKPLKKSIDEVKIKIFPLRVKRQKESSEELSEDQLGKW